MTYLQELSHFEKQLIMEGLPEKSCFYDEYRKIALVIVADLGFLKAEKLKTFEEGNQLLNNSILLGINQEYCVDQVADRIIRLVLEQVGLAVFRGYSSIRVVIPCNTLAPVATQLQGILTYGDSLISRIRDILGIERSKLILLDEGLMKTQFSVPELPRIVCQRLSSQGIHHAVLLGPHDLHSIYSAFSTVYSVNFMELTKSQQQVVDSVVEAFIDGDKDKIHASRVSLQKDVIDVLRGIHPNLVFVEACTDIDLGIGPNANRLFAHEMVIRAYNVDN